MPSPRIHVLNGPNLNLLGTREPHIYGQEGLSVVRELCEEAANRHGLALSFRQTNVEHHLIEWLHEARTDAGIVLNPAAFSYHSVAILDALKICECPIVEVHISNIHRREEGWRANSIMTAAAAGMITGLGIHGYPLAIEHLAWLIRRSAAQRG